MSHHHSAVDPKLEELFDSFYEGIETCPIKLKLEKSCLSHCTSYLKTYVACTERIKTIGKHAHCKPQYFEIFHCLDHCSNKDLFKELK